jgi:protein-arginine kinase activator protein McsA
MGRNRLVNEKGRGEGEGEEQPVIMALDNIISKKRSAYHSFVCQKCKRPESALEEEEVQLVVIVPKQLIILCQDCFLQYSKRYFQLKTESLFVCVCKICSLL